MSKNEMTFHRDIFLTCSLSCMVAANGRPSATLAIIVNRTILSKERKRERKKFVHRSYLERSEEKVQSSSRCSATSTSTGHSRVTGRRCGRCASTRYSPRQSIRSIGALIARPTTIAYRPSRRPMGARSLLYHRKPSVSRRRGSQRVHRK